MYCGVAGPGAVGHRGRHGASHLQCRPCRCLSLCLEWALCIGIRQAGAPRLRSLGLPLRHAAQDGMPRHQSIVSPASLTGLRAAASLRPRAAARCMLAGHASYNLDGPRPQAAGYMGVPALCTAARCTPAGACAPPSLPGYLRIACAASAWATWAAVLQHAARLRQRALLRLLPGVHALLHSVGLD